jgi:hypothetical protein
LDSQGGAIVRGADIELLLPKQEQLKSEKRSLTKRLEELDAEIADLPDLTLIREAAMTTRLRLMQDNQGRDWRKLSREEIKQFLIHLFGDDLRRSGNGIRVSMDSRGQLHFELAGRVEFRHFVSNTRPVSKVLAKQAELYKAELREMSGSFRQGDE